MEAEKPDYIESSLPRVQDEIAEVPQRSKQCFTLGEQLRIPSTEGVNTADSDQLIEQNFNTPLERINATLQQIREYIHSQEGELASQDIEKLHEQSSLLGEQMQANESKLSTEKDSILQLLRCEAITSNRIIQNQEVNQQKELLPTEETLEFELSEAQFYYLSAFLHILKQEIINEGVSRHSEFKLISDQANRSLKITILENPERNQESSSAVEKLGSILSKEETKKPSSQSNNFQLSLGSRVQEMKRDMTKRYEIQAKILKTLSKIQNSRFFLKAWELQVLQLRAENGYSSILESFLQQLQFPVLVEASLNHLELISSNFQNAENSIELIKEWICQKVSKKELKIEGRHLPILSELMTSGFLSQVGLEKSCCIHFDFSSISNDFMLDIYHSSNQDLVGQAEEALCIIREKLNEEVKANGSLRIQDALQLALLQSNKDKFEKQLKVKFPEVEIKLEQKELRIKAKIEEVETIKLIIPELIKELRQSLPLIEASQNFKIMAAVFPEIIAMQLNQQNVQMIEVDKPQAPEEEKEEAKTELEPLRISEQVYLQGMVQNIFEVQHAVSKLKNESVIKRTIEGCKIEDEELLQLILEIEDKCQCQLHRYDDDDQKYVIEGLLADRAAIYLQKYFYQKQEGKGEVSFPEYWEPMNSHNEAECHYFGLDPISEEFKNIETRFMQTMSAFRLVSIQRLQNPVLWKKYALEKELLSHKCSGNPNERQMFHGTSRNDPYLISNSPVGFDFRYCNAGAWGVGSYFARDASYSDQFHYTEGMGYRLMFLALVLEGESFRTARNSSLKMPPVKDWRGTERFDSVISEDGSILVVYEHAKAYPAYLIKYAAQSWMVPFVGAGNAVVPAQYWQGQAQMPPPAID